MTLLSFANMVFAFGSIGAQIAVFAAVLYLLFFRKKYPGIGSWMGRRGMMLAFVAALASVLGSLFYSNIAGFAPCELCWFQRIFMYPLVIILGAGLATSDNRAAFYSFCLAMVGGMISLGHNLVYYYNGGLKIACLQAGAQVSCVKRYVFEFGYITIPMMALTAFVLIILLLSFFLVFSKQKAQ